MGGIVKSIFGSPKKPPTIAQTPLPPAPETKPILATDTEALNKAKKEQTLAASARSGRQSTILSDADETLGG